MAQPYVGEIRMFAGNFAPAGWMFCEGQLLPISENETLFNLIGTTYGGDGQSTFALPDLRGRIPIHQGNGFILAETGGAEEVTLTVQQIPIHKHPFLASTGPGNSNTPAGNVTAESAAVKIYHRRFTHRCNECVRDHFGRRQPAAQQLPALSLHQLHHLAVRHLPVADLKRTPWPIRSSPRSASFPFNFAPKGWAWCDGQLLPLSQNTALFSLLGTTYGGDGKSNFALPDMQGRAPMHPGQGPGLSLHDLGETGGSETVTLLESEIPAHIHTLMRRHTDPGRRSDPDLRRSLCRRAAGGNAYSGTHSGLQAMAFQTFAPAGGDQPHNNMQPYLTFYFNIALQGVFPPRG